MITLWAKTLVEHRDDGACVPLRLYCWDGGTCYTEVNVDESQCGARGLLHTCCGHAPADIAAVGTDDIQVHVFAGWERAAPSQPSGTGGSSGSSGAVGLVRQNGVWEQMPVQIVPLREELFSRVTGLFETDVLADVCVFCAGLGSVGAPVAEEEAKSGIGNFILMDHDRIEVANVIRHVAGLCDIGRYKTRFMAERIRNRNPYAKTETHEVKIAWETEELVRQRVRKSDIVIGAVDDSLARTILNKVCVAERKPLIIPGVFRRAYGCQILFVREPGVTPCYNCFLMTLPQMEENREISSPEQAQRTAYSDRPVAVEPGLSVDIAPAVTMTAKLVTTHLLKGKPTTMRSLEEDLTAPWYMYLNRREAGTDFERLEPLGFKVGDAPHILSWWGIDLKRNPACPVCGDYVGEMAKRYGIPRGEGDGKPSEDPGEGAKDGD